VTLLLISATRLPNKTRPQQKTNPSDFIRPMFAAFF